MASDRRRSLALGLGLVAAVVAVYAVTLGHEFVLFDDDKYVYDNARIRAGLTLEGLRWFATNPHSVNWHPLTSASHMLDVELFGLDAGLHHLTSFVLHALGSVLLFAALRALTGAVWTSAFVAALFAVHPLRVESVAWVSERKDVLSGVFFAATLLAYARYARAPGAARYALVTLLFFLGLASKPMLVTLPALLLVLDAWPLGRWSAGGVRRLVLEKLPWFALAAASGLATLRIQGASEALRPLSEAEFDLSTRVATAVRGALTYVGRTLVPHDLAFFHPHPALTAPSTWTPLGAGTWVGLALLAAATLAALHRRRARPWLAVGWLWFLGMLVPVCGLVQVGEQAWADRYAYLPTVGLYVALAFEARERIAARPALARPAGALALLALGVLGVLAHRQARTWRDSTTLFEHALAATARNYMAANNLGLVRLEEGRADLALEHFREALAVRPADLKSQVNLGIALAQAGQLAEAEAQLTRVAERNPDDARVLGNLGSLLARRGEPEQARARLERARALDPSLVGPHFNLGLLHLNAGALDEAARSLDRALALAPDHLEARFQRGVVHELRGEASRAASAYEAVLAADPTRADAALQLAWLLATTADDALRSGERALPLARALLRSNAVPRWRSLALLAAASAAAGDFATAVEAQEEALSLAPAPRKAEHQAWLERYRAGTPLRVPVR